MPTNNDVDAVLAAIKREAPYGASGAQICNSANMGPHRLYPILARLEQERAITSEWSPPEPTHKPRLRLYWIA